MLERLLGAKVPVWVLVVFLAVGVNAVVGFAMLVNDHLHGPKRFGSLSAFAADVAGGPEAIWAKMKRPDAMRARGGLAKRYGDQAGWSFEGGGPAPSGYLLLSRHDGDLGRAVVELVSLSDGKMHYRWIPYREDFLDGIPRDAVKNPENWTRHRFRAIHPYAAPNGDLYVKSHNSPMMRVSPCGDLIWRQADRFFHHAIEPDADGSVWAPIRIDPDSMGQGADFVDDGAARIAPDGTIVEEFSIVKLLVDNGYKAMLFSVVEPARETLEPLHLNDIQPVLADGPFWKKGDLFVSMRHISSVALIRPSTGKILWFKQGPWMSQHDVDILDDHRIAVFDNDSVDMGTGPVLEDHNKIMVYDFETDEVTRPFRSGIAPEELKTLHEGLMDVTTDGFVVAEETWGGRVVVLRPDGSLFAEYVNRAENGPVYLMNWSRYISAEEGDRLVRTLSSVSCKAS